MNVTALFVELLACGIGVVIWLVLLGCACLGVHPSALKLDLLQTPAVVGVTAVGAYAIGVAFDRIIDTLFDHMFFGADKAPRRRVFCWLPDRRSGRGMSTRARAQERRLSEWLDYYRHRMRMTRSLAFNAWCTAILLLVAHLVGDGAPTAHGPMLCAVCLCFAVGVVSWFSWPVLVKDYEPSRNKVEALLTVSELDLDSEVRRSGLQG